METTDSTLPICILGGGLAGLTLALQLRKQHPDVDILVLEQRKHPVREAAHKVGESSVEIGAYYFSEVLGLKEHMKENQLPKLGLRFFFHQPGTHDQIHTRVELGGNSFFPAGSFQIDRGRFENFLGEECLRRGIRFASGSRVLSFEVDQENGHRLQYRTPEKEIVEITARWLIDASGRAGLMRSTFEKEREVDHKASSVWFRVAKRVKVDDWSDDTRWQSMADINERRWLSTNHLMGEGYWVWLIPLGSGSTSIGIVADERIHPSDTYDTPAKAMQWLEKHEPQCAAQIRDDIGQAQDFCAVRNYSHDCTEVFSKRLALTGEAGLFLDPFYSPGSDFIAISNTMICSLVQRDLKGRPVAQLASVYDEVYHLFFYNNLNLYTGQYVLFGNPVVMPIKIVWDFAYYWAIPASLFFHERLCDVHLYAEKRELLEHGRNLNAAIQALFRNWHETVPVPAQAYHFVDITKIPVMREMNTVLLDEIAAGEYGEHLEKQIQQLTEIAGEIVAYAKRAGWDGDCAVAPCETGHLASLWGMMEPVGDCLDQP